MITLLNKLLARFGFQLVSTKPVKPDTTLVEATVKFMKENPELLCDPVKPDKFYMGDISYVQKFVRGEFPQVSGTTYFKSQIPSERRPLFNYDGEKLAPEELAEKLKND